MLKLKMLVLTDHTNHSLENSLYPLVRALRNHPNCASIDVATRGMKMNESFFKKLLPDNLLVTRANEEFTFHQEGAYFEKNLSVESIDDYDVVWLRLPPPLSRNFLTFLKQEFPNQVFINNPAGIYETGNKKFLMNFADLCPPMEICRSTEQIETFKSQFPIILKPLQAYGGNGLIKIDGERVWENGLEGWFQDFMGKIIDTNFEYLGVKFLKNVHQGDKRIIVINGKIMGATLRRPAEDSWICNVAMGGSSGYAEVDKDEEKIIERINPVLSNLGIVMYGIDTLVGDNGKRVLSEINTTSIGGLPQIANLTGKPLLKEAADLIWKYIVEKKTEQNAAGIK